MFVRVKKVGPYQYLQIAQNRRQGKRVKQSVIATLGWLDKLTASGAIDQLLRSAARFAERVMVLSEHSRDAHDRPDANVVSIGPALIFERLWRETGCQEVVRKLLATRHHHFDVERAVFMTVRTVSWSLAPTAARFSGAGTRPSTAPRGLSCSICTAQWAGSARRSGNASPMRPRRGASRTSSRRSCSLDAATCSPRSTWCSSTPPRCSSPETVATPSASTARARTTAAIASKQMVLGMVIDGDGIPVCSEMWPGNTTDVTTLDQVAARLQSRFGVRRVCLVADAGMISKKMIAAVEARGWFYILGARLRRTKEVRDVVLSDTGVFETVEVARQRPDPMELQVKEVTVSDTPCKGAVKAPHKPRRYVVCRNPDQARKDAATREQILAGLESKLRSSGPKSVVANKGYKRYLKAEKGAFAIDLDKARDEQRFDGMWVLRTNTELTAVEIALRYKQLWMVEQIFRTAKSLLDTRPIVHKG